jgi:Bifunctional DNA primase/polymerase, N-terminal
MTGRLLYAALATAGQGWPVFPLRPGQKRPRPELSRWESRATVDTDRIRRWWARHPCDNVAIATGPAALVVIDLDTAHPDEPRPPEWSDARGGIDVFAALAAHHNQPAPGGTWTVETAGGGRHLYFRAPTNGGPWRNTAGLVGWHIDTRAQGGYVVAAGSIVDGRPYTLIHDWPPIELPAWLASLLTPPAAPVTPSTGRDAPKWWGYGAVALAGEVQRVLDAPHGQRNAALNRAAWNLARHIATGHLTRPDVEDALCAAGAAAGGQTPAGVAATVRSAIDARLRQGATR